MLARLPRLLLALALASSIGLHWAFLQVVAWTGMVLTYSHQGTVAEAVVKTFDGHHPCHLCKQIAKGKRSEQKPEYNPEIGKLQFSHAPVAFAFAAPSGFWEIPTRDQIAKPLTQAPPVPPPRGRLG